MNNADIQNTIINGLLIGELKDQIKQQINETLKINEIITIMKCVTIDDHKTFNERLNYGTNWEQFTLNVLQNKNKDVQYYLINEKNINGDILAIKDDKKTYIEVKSETVTNIYERLFIKAKQFNRNTNYWDDANLLSGSNTDYWVHYFLYNDKWHYIFMTKAELKQLCYKYGSQKIINLNHPYKTAQQGYIIDIDKLNYKEVDLTMSL